MALHIGVADRSPNRGRYIELLQAIAIALMDALNNSDGEVVHIGLNAFSTLLKVWVFFKLFIIYITSIFL